MASANTVTMDATAGRIECDFAWARSFTAPKEPLLASSYTSMELRVDVFLKFIHLACDKQVDTGRSRATLMTVVRVETIELMLK